MGLTLRGALLLFNNNFNHQNKNLSVNRKVFIRIEYNRFTNLSFQCIVQLAFEAYFRSISSPFIAHYTKETTMSTPQSPLGHGKIIWLGINQKRGGFSASREMVIISKNGIKGDRYRGMWRKASGHDGGYIATDGVAKGDFVLNLRQITIVDEAEVRAASEQAGVSFDFGMLNENIVVSFTHVDETQTFSKLPPLSRMVIGDKDQKVLLLTEENGPCIGITKPIADHYELDENMEKVLRAALKNRRGQMTMVRTRKMKRIRVGDSFTIFPSMT